MSDVSVRANRAVSRLARSYELSPRDERDVNILRDAVEDLKNERDAALSTLQKVREWAEEQKLNAFDLTPPDEADCVRYECGTEVARILDGGDQQ